MTRKWKTPEDVPKGSFQSMSPRFQGEAFYDNLKIVDELDRLAKEKGLETSQLALAWWYWADIQIIPIPGSSNAKRVKQNTESADIKLSEDDLKEINRILQSFEIKGGRYPDHSAGLLVCSYSSLQRHS
jgi:pyridoxine 4-dehydrogenase